jgi:hypothetical protein
MEQNPAGPVVAIYIGSDGQIVGSEQLSGATRSYDNQLTLVPRPGDETEVLQVEVRVSKRTIEDGRADRELNFVTARVCYDRFGNRIPCF